MKNSSLKTRIGSTFLGILLLLGSCQKQLDEAFKNPNQSDLPADINNYAASAFYYTFGGSRIMNWNSGNLIYANTWAHQFTHGGVASWFGSLNTYSADFSNDWGGSIAFRSLTSAMGQCRALWQQAEQIKSNTSIAIAKTLFLYNMSVWTQVFGNIPYDDIYQYDSAKVPLQPKYEDQAVVFGKIITELGKISTILSTLEGKSEVNEGDFVYRGDVKKWEKFVNTLRLRLALNAREALKKVNYPVDQAIKETVSRPLVSDLSDEAIMPRGINYEVGANLDGGIEDVYYSFPYSNVDFAPLQEFVDYLQNQADTSKSDPRLDAWCTTPESLHKIISAQVSGVQDNIVELVDSKIKGYPNTGKIHQGVSFAISYTPLLETGKNVSKFKTTVVGKSMTEAPNIRILTVAESKLLQAEATLRNITQGNVKELYDQAITADMKSWGVEDSKIGSYLATGKNSATSPTIQNVMSELWVAYFANSWQAWTVLKRTKYEELGQAIGIKAPRAYRSNANLVMPSRFVYPDAEKKLNPNAVNTSADIGGDSRYSYMGIDIRKVDAGQAGKF